MLRPRLHGNRVRAPNAHVLPFGRLYVVAAAGGRRARREGRVVTGVAEARGSLCAGVSLRETWHRLRSGGASLTRGGRASARGRLWGGHAGAAGPEGAAPSLERSSLFSAASGWAPPCEPPPRPPGPPTRGAPRRRSARGAVGAALPRCQLCSRRFLAARPGRVLPPGPLPWGAAGSPAGPARGRRGGRTASAGARAGFSRLSRRRPKVPKPGPGGWAQRSEPRPRSGARSLAAGWGVWGSRSPPPLSLAGGGKCPRLRISNKCPHLTRTDPACVRYRILTGPRFLPGR